MGNPAWAPAGKAVCLGDTKKNERISLGGRRRRKARQRNKKGHTTATPAVEEANEHSHERGGISYLL
jgi:hypothetical protein